MECGRQTFRAYYTLLATLQVPDRTRQLDGSGIVFIFLTLPLFLLFRHKGNNEAAQEGDDWRKIAITLSDQRV